MDKFKLGPTKTNDGTEVIIFEISDKIYGKMFYKAMGHEIPYYWNLDGSPAYGSVFESKKTAYEKSLQDPNRKPFKKEIVIEYAADAKSGMYTSVELDVGIVQISRIGKFKVTVEELEQ